jgi:hypothetical protein
VAVGGVGVVAVAVVVVVRIPRVVRDPLHGAVVAARVGARGPWAGHVGAVSVGGVLGVLVAVLARSARGLAVHRFGGLTSAGAWSRA